MNFKKTWTKKYGKSEIYKAGECACRKVEMDMLRLADGQSKLYREENKEYALVILGGKCTVEGDDFRFENIGKRKDVFDGPATCVYVPRNTPFTVTAVGEVSIAVSKSPATKDFAPALINP